MFEVINIIVNLVLAGCMGVLITPYILRFEDFRVRTYITVLSTLVIVLAIIFANVLVSSFVEYARSFHFHWSAWQIFISLVMSSIALLPVMNREKFV